MAAKRNRPVEEKLAEFIAKAKIVHIGKQYDYSLFVFKTVDHKGTIICPDHGPFEKSPYHHLDGQGCKKCMGKQKSVNQSLGIDQFIRRSKEIHGDTTYGYDRVVYVNNETKVDIYCFKHKRYFPQTPAKHLCMEQGCPDCANGKRAESLRLTQEEFLERAITVHGDKYSYETTIYIDMSESVEIYCKECKYHFWQNAKDHLDNKGCSECGKKRIGDARRLTNEEFIRRAQLLHGDSYGYDRVVYEGIFEDVEIFCGKCQRYFWQSAQVHLMGCGCSFCKQSKGELAVCRYLDDMGFEYVRQKRFQDCRHKRALPFDFYLPDYNLLIEFDGIQHDKAVEIFGGEEALAHQQMMDGIKNEYAKDTNRRLLRLKTDSDFIKILDGYLISLIFDDDSS